jgi:hypothetical protein
MLRGRALAAGVTVVVAAVAAATPGLRAPFARLANYHADRAGPLYDVPVDDAALRRAGSILHARGDPSYFVSTSTAHPVLFGNVRAAARLYALPALPVQAPGRAGWVLSYRAGRLLPAGLHARRVYRLGPGIALVELAR